MNLSAYTGEEIIFVTINPFDNQPCSPLPKIMKQNIEIASVDPEKKIHKYQFLP